MRTARCGCRYIRGNNTYLYIRLPSNAQTVRLTGEVVERNCRKYKPEKGSGASSSPPFNNSLASSFIWPEESTQKYSCNHSRQYVRATLRNRNRNTRVTYTLQSKAVTTAFFARSARKPPYSLHSPRHRSHSGAEIE